MKTIAGERTRERTTSEREKLLSGILWDFMSGQFKSISTCATCSSVRKSVLCARRLLCLQFIESSLHCLVVFAKSKQKTNTPFALRLSTLPPPKKKIEYKNVKFETHKTRTNRFFLPIKMHEQIKVETRKKSSHQPEQRQRWRRRAMETIFEF